MNLTTRQRIAQFNNCTHVFIWRESARCWQVLIGHTNDFCGFLQAEFRTRKEAKAFISVEFPDLNLYSIGL